MHSLKTVFERAISIFAQEGSKVEGVYDLIIRGGASNIEHVYVDDFSDLDTSVIVENVNYKILNQISELYKKVKEVFPYKLSITVVTKKDFFNKSHNHGIKPLYYQYMLESSISLLRQKTYIVSNKLNFEILRIDCASNVAYLIHDIRNRYLSLNIDNMEELTSFYCHLVKRSKHLVRNILFIYTGHIDEEINFELFKEYFPYIDSEFPAFLKNCKLNFETICKDKELIKNHIEIIMNSSEEIYNKSLPQI